jgi:transcriptional repressor NrdR
VGSYRNLMHCPYCGYPDQKVLESREAREGQAIRRRRECLKCDRRFTTFETYERPRLFVVKRDGVRQEFDRAKLLNSMILACGKRPVPVTVLESTTNAIEVDLYTEFDHEVTTEEIGNRVMEALEKLDTVAYIRYTSVYQSFEDARDFASIVKQCRPNTAGPKRTS